MIPVLDNAQIHKVAVNSTTTAGNSKNGLVVTEDGDGDGTLRVRGSDISEGIDTNVTEI